MGSRPAAMLVGLAIIFNGWAVPAQATLRCYKRAATILGTNGRDTLTGTRRADVIIARGGNDIIIARGGKDRICGGPGEDEIRGGGARDLISGFLGEDKAYGGPGNDLLAGGGRDDFLFGRDGNDTIRGGDGNYDLLYPGTGDDSMFGGPGQRDYAMYANADGPIDVSLQTGAATGSGTDSLTGRAVLAEANGDIEEARNLYQEATQRWADYGFVLEEGQAHLGLARCLIALGDAKPATEPLQKARAIFSRLGAVPLIDEVDRHLGRATALSS